MSLPQKGPKKRKRKTADNGNSSVKIPTGSSVEITSLFPSSASTSGMDSTYPQDVNVVAFAEKRSREIRTLLNVLSTKRENKRLFQKLPRHMRRRAMSHNIKRLPKALRVHAEKETNNAKKPHRPRKKYRKRPKNKKLSYAKRQSVNKWLETHIWHAKRFHMITKWGYKLANFSNDKGFRAAFRASSEHCLMTDLSYLICLELAGQEAILLLGLQKLVSGDVGRTFCYRDYLAGHLEGSCTLYKPGKYPLGAIGVVRFFFVPLSQSNTSLLPRRLFIFVHPSTYQEVIQAFTEAFDLCAIVETCGSTNSDVQSEKMDIPKVEADKQIYIDPPKKEQKDVIVTGYRSAEVSLNVLKDQFVRLRLIGPKSTSILKDILKPAIIKVPVGGQFWWNKYFGDEDAIKLCEKQSEIWNCVNCGPSPGNIRPGSVLSITVRDPRIFLPRKKSSIPSTSVESFSSSLANPPLDRSLFLSSSALWNEDVRMAVQREKMSDHKMNQLRSELPAPGLQLEMGAAEARIPVALVCNAGYQQQQNLSKLEYGAGWDLLIPAGWGTAFWISLIYSGARAGALRELNTVALQAANLKFPEDFPDTQAGIISATETRKELETKFQRYPPNKRPSYIKLGIRCPFHAPWSVLVRDWKQKSCVDVSSSSDFHVIRNIRLLILVQDLLTGKVSMQGVSEEQKSALNLHSSGLLPVHIDFINGGTSKPFSVICIPLQTDLNEKERNGGFSGPVEPKHPDPFQQIAVKQRRKLQVKQILSTPESLLDDCSRVPIGYVMKDGYSFIKGRQAAIGCCSLLGILEFLRTIPTASGTVLVRAPHTLRYQFVKLNVLMSSPFL